MSDERNAAGRPLLSSWIRATTLGWWLGFAFIVVLVFAFEAVGAEGAQFMVGVGMGAGVGYMQGRWMDEWLGSRHQWLWASTIGMGGPFVVGDAARAVGLAIPYSLAAYVVIGSLVVGLLQWGLLRRHSSRAAWWMPVCMAGWLVPVGLIALNDRGIVPGVAGVTIGLVGMFFGGTILGVVTGGLLGRLLPRPAA